MQVLDQSCEREESNLQPTVGSPVQDRNFKENFGTSTFMANKELSNE